MPAIFISPWAIFVWLVVLCIFFVIVYSASESKELSSTFVFHLLGFSCIGGVVLPGLWAAIAMPTEWCNELDAVDNVDD